MNLEFEVKEILRGSLTTPQQKAEKISKIATFNRKNVIRAVNFGGKYVSDIYGNLLKFEKKVRVRK